MTYPSTKVIFDNGAIEKTIREIYLELSQEYVGRFVTKDGLLNKEFIADVIQNGWLGLNEMFENDILVEEYINCIIVHKYGISMEWKYGN